MKMLPNVDLVLVKLHGVEVHRGGFTDSCSRMKLKERDVVNDRPRLQTFGFYNNTAGFQNDVSRIHSHVGGIDFSKEVSVARMRAGERVHAWSHPAEGIGNYVTKEVVLPARVGIGSLAGKADGQIFAKELREYQVTKDSFALKSTAGEFHDFHSLGELAQPPALDALEDGVYIHGMQYAPGGANQYFMDSSLLERIAQ